MAKDSSRITAGELQKKVEFRGQKTFKKIIKQHLLHHMLFGRASRKKSRKENAFTKKTISSIFRYQIRLAVAKLRVGPGGQWPTHFQLWPTQ